MTCSGPEGKEAAGQRPNKDCVCSKNRRTIFLFMRSAVVICRILPFIEDRRMCSDSNPIQKRYIDFNSPWDTIPTGGGAFFSIGCLCSTLHTIDKIKRSTTILGPLLVFDLLQFFLFRGHESNMLG
jgi:hypothetical protein